jgi:hypothetical protein
VLDTVLVIHGEPRRVGECYCAGVFTCAPCRSRGARA